MVTSQEGFSHGKIYADMTGPMDTIIWEFEAASLDQFYQIERGVFINPDAATQSLIDNLNGSRGRASRHFRGDCSSANVVPTVDNLGVQFFPWPTT